MEEKTQPTVEQLQQLVMKLSQENRMLQAQLSNINNVAMSLEVLFKVLKHKDCFPEDYIDKCVNEVMTIVNLNKEATSVEE